MGKLRAMLPLLLAVVIALAASVGIYRWMQHTKTRTPGVVEAPVVKEGVDIALAMGDLPWGTKLTRDMIKFVTMSKDNLPPGTFHTMESLEGRVLVQPVKKNEMIIESRLAPENVTTGGVTAVVSPGKRAVAVAGDKVIGLAGFIQPGNFVDVLVTVRVKQGKDSRDGEEYSVTKMVLSDVKVLATGTVIEKKAGGTEPAPVDVFTLEVTPEEGERLAFAAAQGRVQFALRNVLDRDTVYTMGVTVADALDAYRPRLKLLSREPETSKSEMPRSLFKMEIIKGSNVNRVSFDR